jgi:hypothetical protein
MIRLTLHLEIWNRHCSLQIMKHLEILNPKLKLNMSKIRFCYFVYRTRKEHIRDEVQQSKKTHFILGFDKSPM